MQRKTITLCAVVGSQMTRKVHLIGYRQLVNFCFSIPTNICLCEIKAAWCRQKEKKKIFLRQRHHIRQRTALLQLKLSLEGLIQVFV